MNELRNKFWKETSELIDAHRKNNDERASQGVVDCRILFNRLVKKLTLTDVSQQREQLKAYTLWLDDKLRDEYELNELIDSYLDSL
tara:strand:- start:193 stop:450 length:258 start_codon:yes stop_codon:yes gene_type:complete